MARKKTTWTASDIAKFRELCGCFATRDEVCSTFGITPKTLNRLIEEHLHDDIAPDSDEPVTFQDAFQAYSAAARGSLRRKQFELAMGGDKTMLIFLGKNYLGQSDREHSGESDESGKESKASLSELLQRHTELLERRQAASPDESDGQEGEIDTAN